MLRRLTDGGLSIAAGGVTVELKWNISADIPWTVLSNAVLDAGSAGLYTVRMLDTEDVLSIGVMDGVPIVIYDNVTVRVEDDDLKRQFADMCVELSKK